MSLQGEFYSKQKNQNSSIVYFIENIPKSSKNAAHILLKEVRSSLKALQ